MQLLDNPSLAGNGDSNCSSRFSPSSSLHVLAPHLTAVSGALITQFSHAAHATTPAVRPRLSYIVPHPTACWYSVAECARVYFASKQAPRGEIADRRGAPSPIPYLIGESKILSSAIRRPTSTSALSANGIPRIKQPSTGEQLPSSCFGVSPVSASLVVCITANLLTRGALSVQDAQDPTSFGKNFFLRTQQHLAFGLLFLMHVRLVPRSLGGLGLGIENRVLGLAITLGF